MVIFRSHVSLPEGNEIGNVFMKSIRHNTTLSWFTCQLVLYYYVFFIDKKNCINGQVPPYDHIIIHRRFYDID